MPDDLSRYRDLFLSEAREHLQELNTAILRLEKKEMGAMDDAFRAAHTLKGMSATMGYTRLAALTHEMEGLMDFLRGSRRLPDPRTTDLLLECLDHIEALLRSVEESGAEGDRDISALVPRLHRAAGALPETAAPLPASPPPATPPGEAGGLVEVEVHLDPACALKSAKALLVLRNLESLGRVVRTAPPLEDLKAKRFDLDFKVYLETPRGEEEVRGAAGGISEVARVEVRGVAQPQAEARMSRAQRETGTVRVNVKRLDTLLNLVGELVIQNARLTRAAAGREELHAPIEVLRRLGSDLQYEVMQARLVPADFIFQRFPRMVRDLARQQGKQVDLAMEGADTEMDRTVLEEVAEPLVHLLRNAVDHGIEPPGERSRAGKPETGTIRLAARREKGFAVIAVSDDGRGIHPQTVREAALRRGLLTAEEAQRLTDDQAIHLIARPGFTTIEQATQTSGRGVGVDVVKTRVESLRGSLHIRSEKNRGTTFELRVPLSLAIVQSLLARVGPHLYAIPTTVITEILEADPAQVRTVQGHEVITLREKVVPLLHLDRLFAAPEGNTVEPGVPGARLPVVVVEREGSPVGLVVGALAGMQEVVIKPLDPVLRQSRGFAGATILGDGTVILILDIAGLLSTDAKS
ncbi:MAG: chemotaxis protein CheA [Euryarchaeota archaeon]|nr:chemotaxis protein CheA [Euryarchaeota archaeon]